MAEMAELFFSDIRNRRSKYAELLREPQIERMLCPSWSPSRRHIEENAPMPVIDVDSHWTFPFEFRVSDGPLGRFAAVLPDEEEMLHFFLAEDLMRSLPSDERPKSGQIFPSRLRAGGRRTRVPDRFEVVRSVSKTVERIPWMDKIGIEFALVNSGGFPAAFPVIQDLATRQAYNQACNDLLADELAGAESRLSGVTYADLNDLDWAIGELTRMRNAGSRAFSIRAEPVSGKSLAHPHFDRLWSAVTDLGMIVSVHTGLAPATFGDWGRFGLNYNNELSRARFLRFANSQRHQAVELFLSAMLFAGVLERHPKLSLLIAELNVHWLPGFVGRTDMAGYGNDIMGEWPEDRTPGQQVRQQVRVSPLPGLGDLNALDMLEAHPEIVVFSSDYPHAEGNANPIELYGPRLAAMPAEIVERFMGATIAESFARMGDPILTPPQTH
jgi:predicted TIM-barrel fold metal-dependent hydrolase